MSQIDLLKAPVVVGERLREIRKATGKTINRAATEAGIPPKTLSKIEQGKVDFRILTLGRLCKLYNVGLDKLLEGFDFGPPRGDSERAQNQPGK